MTIPNSLVLGLGSVDVKIGLGWARQGDTARYLAIRQSSPTNIISTPAGLLYPFLRPDVETYTNNCGLSQVKAPQVLANIITNSPSSYTIQLFSPTNILDYTNGGYRLTNSAYRTFTVEAVNGDTNSIRLTDSGDGSAYDYAWQGNGWQLTSGAGARVESKTTAFSSDGTTNSVTTTVAAQSGPEVSTKVETYQTFSYGQRLIQEVFGTGSASKTNTYT